MIDKKRVITMTKLAITEKREGREMMKVISYKKIDYVLTEIFKGALAGTVAFLLILVMWFFYMWDGLNDFIVGLDVVQLITDIVSRYIIFMAAYLVVVAIVAFRRHSKRMNQRYDYLSNLKVLRYAYSYGNKAEKGDEEKDDEDSGDIPGQEDV